MFSHSHLILPSGLFPLSFPAEIVYAFIICPIHATCPTHFILPLLLLDPNCLFNIALKHPQSRKNSIFCHIILCSPFESQSVFWRNVLASCFMLVSCVAYSSTLEMEVMSSSQTSADFQWAKWHYISEDRTLHNHGCENLKSYPQSNLYSLKMRD
jgi:hypothetical protein